ncbi:MAG: hypothetical protein GY754_04515 [bacterium]|nr:hypothetical protein [bacterium]
MKKIIKTFSILLLLSSFIFLSFSCKDLMEDTMYDKQKEEGKWDSSEWEKSKWDE